MQTNSQPLLSVVTVNFNNALITCQLIESLKNTNYKNLEIIVVDNASKEAVTLIETQHPDVILIKNTINKGFAGGNNDGIKIAKGKYIMMLNNDTEVPVDFFQPLVDIMENNSSIGALSPKICYFSNPDTVQFAGGAGINLYTGRGRFHGKNEKDNGQFNDCREIVHGHGAALMISKEAIKKTGLLYEGYFLYYEELDYCEMLKRAGFKIWYAGCSVVYHKESMSVGKENPSKTYYLTRNRLLYLKRNTDSFTFATAMLFFFLIALPKNTLFFTLKRKTHLMKAYHRGVWDYLITKH